MRIWGFGCSHHFSPLPDPIEILDPPQHPQDMINSTASPII
jgi:hypothetical protein